MMLRFHTAFLLLLPAAALSAPAEPPAPRPLDFSRDVRPILAAHCFECHGTDKAKGGLRLTDTSGATAKLKSGATAVVPGHPEASELVARVTTGDADERMPPEKPPLKPDEVQI